MFRLSIFCRKETRKTVLTINILHFLTYNFRHISWTHVYLYLLIISFIIFSYFFFAATHSLRCPPQLHQRRRQLRHPAPHSPALQCRVRVSRKKFANFMIVENCGFLHIDGKFIKIWNGNYVKCNYTKCNFIWNVTLY